MNWEIPVLKAATESEIAVLNAAAVFNDAA
jgi:hypothetical protein